jgi:hypothetical protein
VILFVKQANSKIIKKRYLRLAAKNSGFAHTNRPTGIEICQLSICLVVFSKDK